MLLTAIPSETMTDHAETDVFRREVLAGLRSSPKTLPCKYFYDPRGAGLFIEICGLEEYYPTRTETSILELQAEEIAAALGPDCLVLELGSGEARKTEILLRALADPAGYVPVDISGEQLAETAARIDRDFPGLTVRPVRADYTADWSVPDLPAARRVAFFPGSTIGNFGPEEATAFFGRLCRLLGAGGMLLIGADLEKDRQTLERAYDDARGVTAAFNLNLLTRINRELGADFPVADFRHHAVYNRQAGRIEMYLESLRPQVVHIGDHAVELAAGERICTEHSYKYTLEGFRDLAEAAGFRVKRVFLDPARLFSVQLLEVAGI